MTEERWGVQWRNLGILVSLSLAVRLVWMAILPWSGLWLPACFIVGIIVPPIWVPRRYAIRREEEELT